MGPLSYKRSVVDRNVISWRIYVCMYIYVYVYILYMKKQSF